MGNSEYIKCPRCELNWIKASQKLCDVCKSELNMADIELFEDDAVDEELELCPICKVNYILSCESMCEQCLADSKVAVLAPDEVEDNSWHAMLSDTPIEDDAEILSLSELQDEEDWEEEESFDDNNNPDSDDFDEAFDDDVNLDLDDEDDDDFDDDDDIE